MLQETWPKRSSPRPNSSASSWVFASDGAVLTSDSTLRFRDREEIEVDLLTHGYLVDDIRNAADRPGRELVFLTHRPP